MTREGPDIEALEALFVAHAPRLYLTIAGLSSPTGAALSAAVAHRVLKLAERHDVVIIEDEIFADFEPGAPAPRLAGFDGLDRVIQVGSYSKTISAALRCGYLAARPDWIDSIVDLKLAVSLSSGHFAAAFLHRVLTEAGYRRHLTALRARLADAMGHTLTRLKAAGLTPWIEPAGGVFIWARLPDGLDATMIARHGLAKRRRLRVRLGLQRLSGGERLSPLQRRDQPQSARLRGARRGYGGHRQIHLSFTERVATVEAGRVAAATARIKTPCDGAARAERVLCASFAALFLPTRAPMAPHPRENSLEVHQACGNCADGGWGSAAAPSGPDRNRSDGAWVSRADRERQRMKKIVFLSLAIATAMPLAACDTPQGQNAAGGAVLGGATGALLGGALTGHPGGAIAGGVAGAATGAMIGAASTPPGGRPGLLCAAASAAALRRVGLRLLRQSRLPRLVLSQSFSPPPPGGGPA